MTFLVQKMFNFALEIIIQLIIIFVMNFTEIGGFAGAVYEVLKDGEAFTFTELEKKSALKKEELLLALGWLFREDKIYTKIEVVKKKEVEKFAWK